MNDATLATLQMCVRACVCACVFRRAEFDGFWNGAAGEWEELPTLLSENRRWVIAKRSEL